MKVLLINKFFYLKGGAERVFFNTKRLLEEHGHETIEFAMQHPENLSSPYSKFFVKQTELRSTTGVFKAAGNLYSLDAQRKLDALLKQEKPDIAHLHNAYFQISPSIFKILRKHNVPVVYTVHDYHLVCPNYKMFTQNEVCERCKGHKYYNAVLRKCQHDNLIKSCVAAGVMTFNKMFQFYERGVDHFITPSKFLKKKLVDWNFTDSKHITSVANSVDLESFKADIPAKKRTYILYFGRFSHEKGIPVLLGALRQLPKEIPVKIMGTGPFLEKVQKLAAQMPNVEILPYQNSVQDIVQVISHAQAVVVPSIWYENYPMSVIESFACSTPVIGSKIGGIPELVKNNVTGFTFKPQDEKDLANKIKKLYNNHTLITELGQQARKFVEDNNHDEVYFKRLMKVYSNAQKSYRN